MECNNNIRDKHKGMAVLGKWMETAWFGENEDMILVLDSKNATGT